MLMLCIVLYKRQKTEERKGNRPGKKGKGKEKKIKEQKRKQVRKKERRRGKEKGKKQIKEDDGKMERNKLRKEKKERKHVNDRQQASKERLWLGKERAERDTMSKRDIEPAKKNGLKTSTLCYSNFYRLTDHFRTHTPSHDFPEVQHKRTYKGG